MKIIYYENRNDSQKEWFLFTDNKSQRLSEPVKLFLICDLQFTSDSLKIKYQAF